MEPIFLQSEKAVYSYLKKFLKEKPNAVQLDGSTTAKKNGNVMIVFTYSVDGRKYKLAGDLTRAAAQLFVALTDEHGSPAVVLKEFNDGGQEALILATAKAADGWNCKHYTPKTSDRLKKVA
jgi:hypothetical protein